MSEFTTERIAKDNELIESISLLDWLYQKDDYDGKNWLLFTMSFGMGHDGKEHSLYVTTDHVHSDDLGTAEADVEYVLLACNSYPDALDTIAALTAQVARLMEENRWIPCSERLPEESLCVLTFFGAVKVCYRIDDDWYLASPIPHKMTSIITHWQPLPLPPESEKTRW